MALGVQEVCDVMQLDGRKGLDLSWNIINLPNSAVMYGGSLTYDWLSDGTKVSVPPTQPFTMDISLLDFGARLYDPFTARWTAVDPLAKHLFANTVFGYCANNPINIFDPDGRIVQGVTRQDAMNFRDDLYTVLSDEKFEKVRDLIRIQGKTFRKIKASDLDAALEGVSLTKDENAFIGLMTNAINSKERHKVEYVNGEYTSLEGANAFVNHMNKELGDGVGEKMVTPEGNLSSAFINHSGGGLNVSTPNGSHSFISGGLLGPERAVTSGHEVFGHGIPASRNESPANNNANAIRTDNLIRRIIGLPQRDGHDHGGFKEGHIIRPYDLPLLK